MRIVPHLAARCADVAFCPSTLQGRSTPLRALLHPVIAVTLVACSSSQSVATDAGRETTTPDARADSTSVDTGVDATKPYDGPLPTSVLVRLANLSPDAPGVDFCIAPHATGLWTGPMLSAALGPDALGNVTVVDAGVVVDSGGKFRDSGTHDASSGTHDAGTPTDARSDVGAAHDAATDATLDGSRDAPAEAHPLVDSAASDAQSSDAGDGGSGAAGVPFPRVSPYLSLNPGVYDVLIVAASTGSCTTPLFTDTTDLAGLVAGDTLTLATVGDFVDQGADPAMGLVLLHDDTNARSASAGLRFVNAVPSVIETTLGSGQSAPPTSAPSSPPRSSVT